MLGEKTRHSEHHTPEIEGGGFHVFAPHMEAHVGGCTAQGMAEGVLLVEYRQCFEVKCVDTAPFAGRCITGSNQVSVIVQVTDICPECASDHIDIQALTYNKLSSMETGRISVMYR